MKYIFSSFIVIIWLVSAFSFINRKNDVPEKHLEVVLREVGHRLLLLSKDSTSRVLPIEKVGDDTYQIAFQNAFTFVPDTLINLVHRQLAKTHLPKDYIVNVVKCDGLTTVFAYEINSVTDDLTPCSGRVQEENCYFVRITFLQPKTFDFSLFFLLFIPLGVVLFYLKKYFFDKKEKEVKVEKGIKIIDNEDFIKIGKYHFYEEKNVLMLGEQKLELSERETKALKIFVENINKIVERETLMKALWEDDGVFVISRNLDVLVSKLRKKLADDESLKLTNVHGKGYKLSNF